MESVPCLNCNTFFIPRNKCQAFCSDPDCQRARKALWQKKKLATDSGYKEEQRLAQKKWLLNNPDYSKKYRERNPEKVKRNRSLQRIRNLKKRQTMVISEASKNVGIAKMDARESSKDSLSGEYWLIPVIAKMDPVKIFIASIPGGYP